MQSDDFRPGLLVTVTGEPGQWRVAMYQDNRAAGLGEAVGLVRLSDDEDLELGDDEFDRIARAHIIPGNIDSDPTLDYPAEEGDR